jgi:WD40 repeat protein
MISVTLTLALALAAEPAPPTPTDRFGDPLPPDAIQRLGTLRHRTGWPIGPHQRLYLPDGRMVLTFHREFRWTDAESGREIDRWAPPVGLEINGVSPDGRLALLVDPKAIHIWDLTARREIRVIPDTNRLRGMSSAHFSPDGRQVFVIDQDEQARRRLRCWELATGKLVWKNDGLVVPGTQLFLVSFRPDGRTLVVAGETSAEHNVFVVDRATGDLIRAITTPRSSLVLSPDGKMLVVACGPLRSWDLDTGAERPQIATVENRSSHCAFSADGGRLVSNGPNGNALILEWPSGRLIKKVPFGLDSIHAMGFTSDGKRLEANDFAQSLTRFWDLETDRPVPPPDGHSAPVDFVRFIADGSVVTAGKEGAVRVWDAATGRTIRQFEIPEVRRRAARFLAAADDGRALVTGYAGSPPQEPLRLWDIAAGRGKPAVDGQPTSSHWAAISENGRRLATSWNSGAFVLEPTDDLRMWDLPSGRLARQLEIPRGAVYTFSRNGQCLAVTGRPGPLVYNADDGRLVWQGDEFVSGVAFSPDGRSLACAEGQSLRLYETASGRERLRIPRAPNDASRSDTFWGILLAFSADGRRLAAPHATGVGVWDVATGGLAQSFEGHRMGISSLAFAPDGRTLATASWDTTILLWTIPDSPAEFVVPNADTLWAELAAADAAAAYRAMGRFQADPARAVSLIRDRLKPASTLEAEQIGRWIADLDDDRFAVRDKAFRELAALGDRAEPALRRLLAGRPSPEARHRVEQLLAKTGGPIVAPDVLRELRAVEVLERIATPEARRLLAEIAAGAADARLTEEAKASVERLNRRAGLRQRPVD